MSPVMSVVDAGRLPRPPPVRRPGAGRSFLAMAVATLVLAAGTVEAVAQPVRISGRVRNAETGASVPNAQVRLEGPALADRENSQVRSRQNPQGRYQLDAPPGAYDLWVVAPDFEELKLRVVLSSGENTERDFDLRPLPRSNAYRVETLPLPRQLIREASGIAFTPKGSMVITNRRGEVWIQSGPKGEWRKFAYGLYEGFGVAATSESDVLVIQRPELTRVRDTTGDGVADVYETLADGWGITGNYHEFTYGLARDSAGNAYFGSGMVSYGRGRELPWVRGPLKIEQYLPWTGKGAVPDGHRSVALYQGWVFQVTPDGRFTPFATGFRQPLGIGVSPNDELFVSDVAGAWVPTSTLMHVEKDGFYGHPDPLKWHPEYKEKRLTVEQLSEMRRPPTVYLPRGLMGTSPGQPVWDTTGGRFGPFGGQMFIGDVTSLMMRVDLQKVAGVYQGAVFPFIRGMGLRLGGMHNAFGPDGALYIAQTVRGWMSTEGNEGIQRIVWTGENPVDILTFRLTDKGFALRFTEPMAAVAGDARQYQLRRFQYNYHPLDGSLRVQEADVPVTAARLSPDGRSLELDLIELQPDFIYEFVASSNVVSSSGLALLNSTAYYTANRLLSGQTRPGPSTLVAQSTAALKPADASRGRETYLLYCVACHQPDGRGSQQIGTPDYTAAESPLKKPDEELLGIIANGRNQMPPFGNVLPAQSIHDVLAYLREAFLAPSQPGAAAR
jgi:mono/diheme cytochrome c family protein